MNLVSSTVFKQNLTMITNWADSTPVPSMIDSFTYDLYESNNPFRKKFTENEIHNKQARIAANAGTAVSAEIFSVFANPYYLTHKISQLPAFCSLVVEAYKKNTHN